MAQGRGWRQGGVNSLERDGGLGMSIINLISLQTQTSLLLNNPPTSSGLTEGVRWTPMSNTRSLASLSTYWLTQSSLVVTRSHLMINSSLFYQKLISVSGTKPLWNFIDSHRATHSLTSPGCLFRDCDFLQVKSDIAKKLLCHSLPLCTESSILKAIPC